MSPLIFMFILIHVYPIIISMNINDYLNSVESNDLKKPFENDVVDEYLLNLIKLLPSGGHLFKYRSFVNHRRIRLKAHI